MDFEKLKKHCNTARQVELCDALIKHKGNETAVARALGISRGTVQGYIRRLKDKAAVEVYNPAEGIDIAQPGQRVAGVSRYEQLVLPDGRKVAQWTKTKESYLEQQMIIQAWIEGLASGLREIDTTVPDLAHVDYDTVAVYGMGDAHIGVKIDAEETGMDWDLKIAEEVYTKAIHKIIDRTESSDTAVIINAGDLTEADDSDNHTKRNKHPLDVDSRHWKTVKVAAKIMLTFVDVALTNHKTVIVRNVAGNHDEETAHHVTLVLDILYANNPRVIVETSKRPVWYRIFGDVCIAACHGHAPKPERAVDVLNQYLIDAGCRDQAKHVHLYHGHIHSLRSFEKQRTVVEALRILTPNNAWAHASGYQSVQWTKSAVFSRKYGLKVEKYVTLAEIIDA